MPDESEPPTALCVQCGEKPGKPKFCSRSCAATFNNHHSPKRGLKGKCSDCGTAVPAGRTRCADCTARAAAVKRRIDENFQSFRTLTGEARERPVPKAYVHGTMVFEPHPPGGRRFSLADPCGDFLDALLGVVFARPAYIRPDDIHRYAAWIDAFQSHVLIDRYSDQSEPRQRHVSTLPLRHLIYSLRDWVATINRADNHALFPTLALDAAKFIEGHAREYCGGGRESWEITGLVSTNLHDAWVGEGRLADPRLKQEITGRLKGTTTKCVVPYGGRVPGRENAPPLVEPGESFVFVVERCHLSHENFSERPCARAFEGDAQRFDIAADLWFRGILLLDAAVARPIACLTSHTDLSWRSNCREAWVEIPFRWITDIYEWPDRTGISRLSPVPRWGAI